MIENYYWVKYNNVIFNRGIILTKLLILFICLPIISSAKSPKAPKFTADFKYSQLSIQQKKKKLMLTCKPLKSGNSANSNWISECNNVAFNLLSQDKYQEMLVEKYVEDQPFGNLSYQAAKESGASFMKKKSIRKSFKIISD